MNCRGVKDLLKNFDTLEIYINKAKYTNPTTSIVSRLGYSIKGVLTVLKRYMRFGRDGAGYRNRAIGAFPPSGDRAVLAPGEGWSRKFPLT